MCAAGAQHTIISDPSAAAAKTCFGYTYPRRRRDDGLYVLFNSVRKSVDNIMPAYTWTISAMPRKIRNEILLIWERVYSGRTPLQPRVYRKGIATRTRGAICTCVSLDRDKNITTMYVVRARDVAGISSHVCFRVEFVVDELLRDGVIRVRVGRTDNIIIIIIIIYVRTYYRHDRHWDLRLDTLKIIKICSYV